MIRKVLQWIRWLPSFPAWWQRQTATTNSYIYTARQDNWSTANCWESITSDFFRNCSAGNLSLSNQRCLVRWRNSEHVRLHVSQCSKLLFWHTNVDKSRHRHCQIHGKSYRILCIRHWLLFINASDFVLSIASFARHIVTICSRDKFVNAVEYCRARCNKLLAFCRFRDFDVVGEWCNRSFIAFFHSEDPCQITPHRCQILATTRVHWYDAVLKSTIRPCAITCSGRCR